MHLEYQAGDIIMVDFAGKKQHYVDTSTGEQISCHVFVATLPFSALSFAWQFPHSGPQILSPA